MKELLLIFLTVFLAFNVEARSFQNVKVYDDDEIGPVDTVVLSDGRRALSTSGVVQIEQLFGRDPQGSTFFFIGTQNDADGVGSAGDTVRIQITAAPSPLNVLYPAVDVTTTVTAGVVADPNPERALAGLICDTLEADPNFLAAEWECVVMPDFSGVFIHSNLYNEFGTRTGCILPLKCFDVSSTGSTVVTEVYTEIEARGYATELSRSPNNPRLGVLAISGTVQVTAQAVSDLLIEPLQNGGGDSMAVDGSTVPVVFELIADQTGEFDFIIQKISCYCSGNGIQFTKYCSLNQSLSQGVLFEITSQGVSTQFANIKSTDDWKHLFTLGDNEQYSIDIQSGSDDLMSTAVFNPPILLDAGTTDKIRATVRDNLSQLNEQKCRVFGFKRED